MAKFDQPKPEIYMLD